MLLDRSAAFDTIDHSNLFELLGNRFGARGSELRYLGNRSSSVYIYNCSSSSTGSFLGVPQGSVLGPIILTIYTTPVADIIKYHGLS